MSRSAGSQCEDLAPCELTRTGDHRLGGREKIDVRGDDKGHRKADYHL
jgi:hypothetical protein